jgi:hypothetical protein
LVAGSGAYLAFFFLNHVGAVLFAQTRLSLGTNFYFAAAGFHVHPFQFYFAPYYFLGVLALFIHLGCAFYWWLNEQSRSVRIAALAVPVAVGATLSLLIVLMLAGVFYTVDVSPEYKSIYELAP